MSEICSSCKEEVMTASIQFDPKTHERTVTLCKRCKSGRSVNLSVFPFMVPGLGSPEAVEVTSLRHLRQLERKHGVENVAFNQNSNNWGPPTQREQPRNTDPSITVGKGEYHAGR